MHLLYREKQNLSNRQTGVFGRVECMQQVPDSTSWGTNGAGLMTRPAWMLMHQLPPYKNCPRAPLPVAESLARRIINLPSSAGLV